jgi:uncharacterized protein (DUF433 family)
VTIKTFRRIFGYNEAVRVRKPTREVGQDLSDLPTYSISEAASFLAIPPRTMTEWFAVRRGLFTPSGDYGSYSLLSFRDLAEAYMLYVLRHYHHFSLFHMRRVLSELRKETQSQHPLLRTDIKLFASSVMLDKPPRGNRGREVVDLSNNRQLALGEVVDAFSKRILQDDEGQPIRIFPWRLFAEDHESRPVAIDPKVMSGRLVVTGTRIPVSILVGMKIHGKSTSDIAKTYRLDLSIVEKALLHFERPVQKVA